MNINELHQSLKRIKDILLQQHLEFEAATGLNQEKSEALKIAEKACNQIKQFNEVDVL